MLTKSDFQKAIADSIMAHPAVAPLYQAGDPRILQHLDAMATMLAMFSAQIEGAMSEPFEKSRNATILADAAMRGIVRKAVAARVQVVAKNNGNADFSIESGRVVIDSNGLAYRIETAALVPTGGTATFAAIQQTESVISHVVTNSAPFYAIEIPSAPGDSHLCGISVSDSGGEFVYSDRYVNIAPSERVFHVEVDDRQRAYVRFGFEDVVGSQPQNGDQITLKVIYTAGEINPEYESPFSFEYIRSPLESQIELSMSAMLTAGQNPPSIDVLRDLSRYPSVYDNNAVFLGEFDFLVRRNFTNLQFLAVWNESAEEIARGPKLENINTLFVACLSSIGSEPVLHETDPQAPVSPELIKDAALTDTQKAIRDTILKADDSYKVRFFTPVRSEIRVKITAIIATSYVASVVRQSIEKAILSEFGEKAAISKHGKNKPLYQRIYVLLRQKIPALAGIGSDLIVSIDDPASIALRPEMWRYVSPTSLLVSVETTNTITPSWS